jgi:hypothetical protein
VIFFYIISLSTFLGYLHYFHLTLHVPYACPIFNLCCANVDVSLLHCIARRSSLNRVLNKRPV